MSLIQEVGLMKIVTGFGKCYEMLIREFIVNIFKECDNKRSKEFRKIYVRGRCVDFSPEIINRFLCRNEEEQAKVKVSDNVICREITTKQVKEWPRKGKLSARTKSSFDFGSYVFDQTMKHDASYAVKMSITFPSLIYGVILSKHPSILTSSQKICKRDPPFTLHYRLFIGKHVPDTVLTSGQTAFRPTTRTGILAELKDTCKILDETIKSYTERKHKIEMLIKALSEE
ncbi:uncharacterized protein LOC127130460 [Lathyrus oleraceus]|uniref:uncharacterized protein LOC127130460 n=1 Tax=Pisum sativum TaxID=3888 RepID=UPI0021D1B0DF|nr:uncharacterized protein LOC127130460 [Pisum sativum]